MLTSALPSLDPQVLVRAAEERGGQAEKHRYLDAEDAAGQTALMRAVSWGTEETVKVRGAYKGWGRFFLGTEHASWGHRFSRGNPLASLPLLPIPLYAGAAGCWGLSQTGRQ